MTYGEAKQFIGGYLRGDNSSPTIEPIHFKMAILEIATRCVPKELTSPYTGDETDVFRLLPIDEDTATQQYIKIPDVPQQIDDTEEMPIDQQLAMAVIFYVCSYHSNKNIEKYENKAELIISVFVSNELH
jgi:hypothetical protein